MSGCKINFHDTKIEILLSFYLCMIEGFTFFRYNTDVSGTGDRKKKLKVSYVTVKDVKPNITNANEFKMGRYYFVGKRIIKKPCFYCENCHSKFSIEVIKAIEKSKI